jgi:hypothetical protein
MCTLSFYFSFLATLLPEYWITTDDEGYNKLMRDVSQLIRSPGAFDVPVEQVFTQVIITKRTMMPQHKDTYHETLVIDSDMCVSVWVGVGDVREASPRDGLGAVERPGPRRRAVEV